MAAIHCHANMHAQSADCKIVVFLCWSVKECVQSSNKSSGASVCAESGTGERRPHMPVKRKRV